MSPDRAAGDGALLAGVARIAAAASAFRDPWWIIGSAAARLIGAEAGAVRDIDLLLSRADAERLVELWRDEPVDPPPSPHPRFRSAIFRRFISPPLPIEAMGGFEIRGEEGWAPVALVTRLAVDGAFVPAREEQIALMRLMGREKDRARIAAIARLA